MNAKTIKGVTKDAATIAAAPFITVAAFGYLLAAAVRDRLRGER
jgi:hypothetical protein